ncbi:interleukin 19 like isoform X1 [Fundulus heteroclitus]|uniref:interleukin 19 like isoform X1 n=2 Tax=Fundulus heteroclitus TaxID=8078 RepID=UPI00165BDD5C|nr:interleukin 19 like isoform X1 [Fundulus heteroclitus]
MSVLTVTHNPLLLVIAFNESKCFHQSHLPVTTVMKILLSSSICTLLLLGFLNGPVESRTMHADGCSANVHFHELHKHFSDIRSDAISADGEIAVKLLDTSLMKNVQEGQTCCFVRLLLRFYVERVFRNYESSQPHQQRCASSLANAFVSIRKEMHKCHCNCGEETQRTIDSVLAKFDKLQIEQAAQKAVGELDTVLEWLEGLAPKS